MASIGMLGRLLDEIPLGIVLLDLEGRVVFYNRYEEALAGRERKDVTGRLFFDEVAPCLKLVGIGEDYRARAAAGELSVRTEVSFELPIFDRPRDVLFRLHTFDFGGDRFGLVMVEDISQQRSIERMKELLSSLVVHDLKNPLSVVTMSLEAIDRAEGVDADSTLRRHVDRSLRAAGRLNRMISTLLETSRLEATGFHIEPLHVDLHALVEGIVRDLKVLGASRKICLKVELPDEPVTAFVDARLVERAIENLIDNAFRHAESESVVKVSLTATIDDVALTVEDDGPGVPEELREKIFERFVRVGAPTDGEHGFNVGLGLTLVKMVARAHGGFVKVTCPLAGGRGSIFHLQLPRRRLARLA